MRKRPVRKKNPLYKSFGYAFEGIFNTFGAERNMKIHCLMAVAVIVAGIICRITRIEWFICLILFGLVTSLELVNTAVEAGSGSDRSDICSIDRTCDICS